MNRPSRCSRALVLLLVVALLLPALAVDPSLAARSQRPTPSQSADRQRVLPASSVPELLRGTPTLTPTNRATAPVTGAMQAVQSVYLPIVSRGGRGSPVPTPESPTPTPTPEPPEYTLSYYITGADAQGFVDFGCGVGKEYHNGIVILSFGQPDRVGNSYGVRVYDKPSEENFVDLSTVEALGMYFLIGYWGCSPSAATITIAMGTTNCGTGNLPENYPCPPGGDNVTREHGSSWGGLVSSLHAYNYVLGYDEKITVAGAIDIEQSWNFSTDTREWVDGYNSATSLPYYNFGSCDGCPTFDNPESVPGGPPGIDNSWTLTDVLYVSWEVPPARVIPQIYLEDGVHAQQWYLLKVWGIGEGKEPMIISGALTQHTACSQRNVCSGINNTPTEGWKQLWRALNDESFHDGYDHEYNPEAKQDLTWSTDMSW